MPDTRTSGLTAQTGAGLASGDLIPTVDVSDATMAATGTDKSITIANLLLGLAGAGAAFTSFTPGISGTGWALGNGTIVGRYMKIGRLVFYQINVTFGSTTTYGTGGLGFTGLPFTSAAAPAVNWVNPPAEGFDSSAFDIYPLRNAVSANNTTVSLWPFRSDGTYLKFASVDANVTATVPVTWASGDSILVCGFYEASS